MYAFNPLKANIIRHNRGDGKMFERAGLSFPKCFAAICRAFPVRRTALLLVVLAVGLAALSSKAQLAGPGSGSHAGSFASELSRMFAALDGFMACIIKCGDTNSIPSEGYGKCVHCCYYDCGDDGRGTSGESVDPTPSHIVRDPIDTALLEEARAWAHRIQRMRTASADPRRVLSTLRSFFLTDWSTQLREQYVDPVFVAGFMDLALSEDGEPEWVGLLLHDTILDVAQSKHLEQQASAPGQAAVLAIAVWLSTPDELSDLEGTIEQLDIADEVAIFLQILEAHGEGAPFDDMIKGG